MHVSSFRGDILNKQLLVVSDIAGYGKVALSVMIPVLSKLGVNTHNLPTAVVSNTLDYGKFEILDTTDFMGKTLSVWDELGFKFDAVTTGFVCNKDQVDMIVEYCKRPENKDCLVFCDPIMGDEGSLYPGMDASIIDNMRTLMRCADYVVPNYTEAALLTGHKYSSNPDTAEVRSIVDGLRELGPRSVIVTSVLSDNTHYVSCYDHVEDRYFDIPFDNIDMRFPGTGDIFSAVLTAGILNGDTLYTSVLRAMNLVCSLIEKNLGCKDAFRGIDIENCLDVIEL